MFVGHFSVGLAAKHVARRVPLPVLLVAPQVPDVLWPILVALGVERAHVEPGVLPASPLVLEYMPYSHGALAVAIAAVVCGVAYAGVAKDRRGGAVVAALVASHWVLDWVAHAPDMPLVAGDGPRYGLGLWRSLPATLVVELGMFLAGAAIYARTTRATHRVGWLAWWALVVVLVGLQLGAMLGPAPPNIDAVLVAAAGVVLVVPWAWWIERHRALAA